MKSWLVMTRSHTLVGLPSAGEISQPHDFKQSTNMQDISKTRVLKEKHFEDFRRKKERKQNSRFFKNTPWNTRHLNTTLYPENYCASYKINFLGPKRLLKTQIFEKKGYLSSEEKILANFFSYYRT